MTEATFETLSETAESEEMTKFYRMLSSVQLNSVFYVISAKDAEEMKTRATELTTELENVVDNIHKNLVRNLQKTDKCSPSEIWNPITKKCEPA